MIHRLCNDYGGSSGVIVDASESFICTMSHKLAMSVSVGVEVSILTMRARCVGFHA